MANQNPAGHDQYTTSAPDAADEQSGDVHGGTTHAPTTQSRHESDSSHAASGHPQGPTSSTGGAEAGGRTHTPAKRGFAAMDEAMQRTIASKGGQSQGKENNPGNFANNRERAREAGRKGGEAHGHRANRAQPSHENQNHHP